MTDGPTHDISRRAFVAGLVSTTLAGCGLADQVDLGSSAKAGTALPAGGAPNQSWAVADPGSLNGKLLSADVLVVSDRALPASAPARVNDLAGVRKLIPLSIASIPVDGRALTVAAVDAAAYRRFTSRATAAMDEVWQVVAAGDIAVTHQIAEDVKLPLGATLVLGDRATGIPLRTGAYATTVPQIDAVVNLRRGTQLGMTRDNALLVSLGKTDRTAAVSAIRHVLPKGARVQSLTGMGAGSGTRQAAYLTGGAVARAVGSFSYRYFPDGSVEPDRRWVARNIRTARVPILGSITCHRVVVPQLRAALQEVVDSGLASKIHPREYGGCYVPRFIGRDPAKGLSLHTWGIAVDLNVPGNQRGTVGEIDRRVVAIFKRWGFAWGGDWRWTDPMHFELAALVRT